MRLSFSVRALASVVVLLSAARVAPAASGQPPVAIVSFLAGKAWRTDPPETTRTPLELFDRLGPGATVSTGDGSRVVLAFVSGDRFALGASAEAAVTTEGLRSLSGPVDRLAPVPTAARVLPLAVDESAGRRAGASRIRLLSAVDPGLAPIAPTDGEMVLADAVALAFSLCPETSAYRVEVEDEAGKVVLDVTTTETGLVVPAGVLRPGALYLWRVRAMKEGRTLAAAEALFGTLSRDRAEARQALAAQTAAARDSDLWALLAAVDRGLDLNRTACADLERALELTGPSPALDQARASFGCPAPTGPATGG